MSYRSVNPQQAHDLMKQDQEFVYVDVRSEQEFAAGHPEGAINLPIAFMSGGGMAANPDFVRVATAKLKKDAKLLVGCKMGGRSMRACEVLSGAGFTNLVNVDGGFSGRGDGPDAPTRGGWSGAGLPVSKQPKPGATWAELSGR